jgi:hypothetical protein
MDEFSGPHFDQFTRRLAKFHESPQPTYGPDAVKTRQQDQGERHMGNVGFIKVLSIQIQGELTDEKTLKVIVSTQRPQPSLSLCRAEEVRI